MIAIKIISNLLCAMLFCSILSGCYRPNDTDNIKYFGTVIYPVNDTVPGNEYVWKHLKVTLEVDPQIIDSLLNDNDLKVRRDQHYNSISDMDLYGVNNEGDTSCFHLMFSTDKYAVVELYSNCDYGLMLYAYKSEKLYYYFQTYFINNYNIQLVPESSNQNKVSNN